MQPADRTTVVAVATLLSRYALIVPFDDLADAVDEWRERTCVAKPSHGVPPHVTLLLPCPSDVEGIGHVLEPFPAFDVVFRDVGSFPGALWLAPEPDAVFRTITGALVEAFPGHLPYGGRYPDVIPHLTVAQGELDAAEAALRALVPLVSRSERALLIEQIEPPLWNVAATFELAAA